MGQQRKRLMQVVLLTSFVVLTGCAAEEPEPQTNSDGEVIEEEFDVEFQDNGDFEDQNVDISDIQSEEAAEDDSE